MKDMTMRDIFPRVEDKPTQVVQLLNGHWRFVTPNYHGGIQKYDGAMYFRYLTPFGIVLNSETNARRLYKRGEGGDFLVHNPGGYYDIMTEMEYKHLYPSNRGGGYGASVVNAGAGSSPTGGMGY